MKWVLILVLALLLSVCGLWLFRGHPIVATPPKLVAVPMVLPLNKTVPPTVKPPPLMASSEWERYRSARQSALDSNPSLQHQYGKILQQMDGQQARLDSAMEKADPNLAPVIAKLKALRAQNGTPAAFPKPQGTAAATPMTADDWQELRRARAKAVSSDPTLMTVSNKLQDEMRSFEASLDATMIKADPGVQPVIAKFEGHPAFVDSTPSGHQRSAP